MIILTGGAGFIGSCLLERLNREGLDDILVVDHLGTGEKWKNLRGKRFAEYMDKEEFLDTVVQGGLEASVEAVFHLGACSSTTETDAGYLMQNNTQYSRLLAQWALDSRVPFLYASSAATYGDGGLGYSDDDRVTPTLKPLNMYGFSKQLFDDWALRNGLLSQITGFKFFNVFGPNEYHKGDMKSLVVKAHAQVLSGGPIRLFKSYREGIAHGEQVRDFIYVKDAVEVLWYAFKNPDLKGLFNLGTGRARSWNSLATAVFAAMGRKPDIEYIDMPEALRGKYQYHTQADTRKLFASAREFEFTPLEEAVKDYVQNYLDSESYL